MWRGTLILDEDSVKLQITRGCLSSSFFFRLFRIQRFRP